MYKLYIIVIVISFVYKTTAKDLEQCVGKATLLNNTLTTYSVVQLKPLELQDCLMLCCSQEKCLAINFYFKTTTKSNCSLVYYRNTICFEKKNGWNHYIIRKSDRPIAFIVYSPKTAHLCSGRLLK
ncbi:unnamed protein product [Schistosoma rodhaini]|uniref:Apple domain-containing protein n=1 Tax=Schistosoma rodhaini TaxID=6188 RepID=A0AA85F235_9TREM|nr:unnamed protein product [Schistosoma rodhaini]